jgi:hypothetical protein
MLAIASAACRQIGFRAGKHCRQSGIAGENQKQRDGDELGHNCSHSTTQGDEKSLAAMWQQYVTEPRS